MNMQLEEKTIFNKFHSIEEVSREKIIELIHIETPNDILWVATEKIHGANFSFITTGTDIQVGKRNSIIHPHNYKTFYNCVEVIDKYKENIKNLYQEIIKLFPNTRQITIYGELFGGHYPGCKQISHTSGILKTYKPVQHSVYYIPHIDFYAFDICIQNQDLTTFYLDFDLATQLFKTFDFLYAHELYRGTLDNILKWSKRHNEGYSWIPNYFGLTNIQDNIKEGNVLRPIKSQYSENGDFVILKDKNRKFIEKSLKPKKVRENTILPVNIVEILNEVKEYIT